MFRRESPEGSESALPPGADGAQRYTVLGLWGSGNVVVERYAEDPTSFSMWDGHALFGPGRPGAIEKFPALVSTLDVRTFVDRYGGLGDGLCELWDGEEELGAGCRAACANVVDVCPSTVPAECLAVCSDLPRQQVECLSVAEDCNYGRRCSLPD